MGSYLEYADECWKECGEQQLRLNDRVRFKEYSGDDWVEGIVKAIRSGSVDVLRDDAETGSGEDDSWYVDMTDQETKMEQLCDDEADDLDDESVGVWADEHTCRFGAVEASAWTIGRPRLRIGGNDAVIGEMQATALIAWLRSIDWEHKG